MATIELHDETAALSPWLTGYHRVRARRPHNVHGHVTAPYKIIVVVLLLLLLLTY